MCSRALYRVSLIVSLTKKEEVIVTAEISGRMECVPSVSSVSRICLIFLDTMAHVSVEFESVSSKIVERQKMKNKKSNESGRTDMSQANQLNFQKIGDP